MINLSIFNNAMFIVLMSTGVCVWLIGLYVMRNQPPSPNKTYGYRTPRSMKSQEAWDYAQVHGTQRMIYSAQLMCLLAIAALFFETSEMVGVLIGVFLMLVLLFVPLIMTERELKDKFESDQ